MAQSLALGAGGTGAAGPTPPPQAAAVGYNTRTFSTTTFTTGNTDMSRTNAPGFQWYFLNWFGFSAVPVVATINGDGSITEAGSNGSGDGAGSLTTVVEKAGVSPFWHGTAFGGGFYAEAVFLFDASATIVQSHGWPAWWKFSLEHILSHAKSDLTQDIWPQTFPTFTGSIAGSTLTVSGISGGVLSVDNTILGTGVTSATHITAFGTGTGGNGNYTVTNTQTVGSEAMSAAEDYEHFAEIDTLEYFGSVFGGNVNDWYGSLHDWYGPATVFQTSVQNQQAFSPGRSSFNSYHKYGCLWVPATGSTSGYVNFYYDGVQVGSTVSWTQLVDSDHPIPQSPYTFGIIDQNHLALVIGGSQEAPMTIQSVNVWQASAANNLTS